MAVRIATFSALKSTTRVGLHRNTSQCFQKGLFERNLKLFPAIHSRRDFHGSNVVNAKKQDYYQTLGIKKGASDSEIKKAYFKKAKQYHPDTNKDNKEAVKKFQEVSEAYEVLGNNEKKSAYDQFGHAGVDPNNGFGGGGGGGFGGGGFSGGFGGGAQGMDMNDLFEELFTGRRRGPRKGGNLQYRLRLSFLEAVHGCTKPIHFQFQKQSRNGKINLETRNTKVDIPPGVETGMTMAVSGEGSDGDEGMPKGDLYVEIEVDKDPYFKRDPHKAEDVHVEVPIHMTQAALGDKIELLSLDGLVDLKIPSGTQPGAKLLMRNKGIARVNSSGRGNQYVHLKVVIPKKLTDKQRRLLEQFYVIDDDDDTNDDDKDMDTESEESGKKKQKVVVEDCDKSFTSLVQRTLKKLGDYIKK